MQLVGFIYGKAGYVCTEMYKEMHFYVCTQHFDRRCTRNRTVDLSNAGESQFDELCGMRETAGSLTK